MATTTAKKEKAVIYLLDAEGRGINLSLFERDAYQDDKGGAPGKPMYKVEMAYNSAAIEDIENQMADFIDNEKLPNGSRAWPAGTGDKFLNGEDGWLSPFINGDLLAKAREEKGKSGDAYKGKKVLRVKTAFNHEGVDGPGGTRVYGPDLAPVGEMHGNKADVYNGCMGKIAVTMKTYTDFPRRGDKGVTLYLHAFQKTDDAPPLRAEGGGAPNPFTAVAGTGTGDTGGGVRRRRAG